MKAYEIYKEKCEICSNTGFKKDKNFCECPVGMAESLMGVSAEADNIIEGK